jgi:hypothetical protein
MDPDAIQARQRAFADSLHVSIEEIRHIANATFGDLQDNTRAKAHAFAKADVGESAFTRYPLAQALAGQHQAAVSVFTATMDGVMRDLERFQTALLDSAKEYENTDDGAAAALAAVDNKFTDEFTLNTQNTFDGARHEQGSALETPDSDKAAPPAEAAPASSEPGPTADETIATS